MVLMHHHANVVLSKVLAIVVRQLGRLHEQMHLVDGDEHITEEYRVIVDVGAAQIQ